METIIQKIGLALLAPFIAITGFFSVGDKVDNLQQDLAQTKQQMEQRIDVVDDRVTSVASSLQGKFTDLQDLGASFAIPTPIALFETSLASKITSSATTMTLNSATDKDGNTLASSTYAFIIDEGTASEEFVVADCTGTACEDMIRGLSVLTGTSTVASLQKEHRRGASVKITDGPMLLILSRILNGIATVPNLLAYTSGTVCTVGSPNSTICDKAYIDGVVVAGASNANETTKGISELATAAELALGTSVGGTAARLVIPNSLASSTPDGTSFSANKVIVSKANGKINQLWLDLTEAYTFTGTHTYNGTTNLGVTNLNATTTVGVNGKLISDGSMRTYTCGAVIAGNQPVYVSATSTRIMLADSDTPTTTVPFVGFALDACTADGADTTAVVQSSGIYTKAGASFTPGALYYINATAGTIGTSVGTVEGIVGRATSATEINLDEDFGDQYLGVTTAINTAGSIEVPTWARTIVITATLTNGANDTTDSSMMVFKRAGAQSHVLTACDIGTGQCLTQSTLSISFNASTNSITGSIAGGGVGSGTAYFYY